MAKKKKKYYVVWKGKKPGIYQNWSDCKMAVTGVEGAQYKSFPSHAEAKAAYDRTYLDFKGKKTIKKPISGEKRIKLGHPNLYSIAVDAASSGNPGKMEYRGVETRTKKKLFHKGPFSMGTNNIGEFLALVHGLAFLKEHKSERIVYSDSRIAMGWVKKKKCNTKLKRTAKNEELFLLVERAEKWLKNNTWTTPIAKWETKAWGEIPADFGRK